MKTLTLVFLTGLTVLAESVAIPVEEKFICSAEGRFVDSSDCSSFFECVLNTDKSLTPYRRSCHGKAFNPKTLSCVNPSKIKGCKIREGRIFTASTRFRRLCKSKINEFACGDCATQVTCSDGIAYETQCESNLRCVEGLNGFSGGVCHLKYKDQCRCQEPNTYYQDPYYNGTFFLCREKDSVPMFYNCPTDMYFNTSTKTCLSRDGTPACTKKGLFVYPNDCSKYYMCTYAVEGWVQSRLKCPPELLFNEETEVCENPCEWAHKDFKCEEEGRFRNPKDCNQYFECILDLNGEFLKMMRSCPPDHHWNDDKKGCVYYLQSVCKVQSEGPIKQCRNDYQHICENQKFPQIEEKPANISDSSATNGEENQDSDNNKEQSSESNITTVKPGGTTETLINESNIQGDTSTETQNPSDNAGENSGTSGLSEGGQSQQESESLDEDKQGQVETSSEIPKESEGEKLIDSTEESQTENTDGSHDAEVHNTQSEGTNSQNEATNKPDDSTEKPFQSETTSKGSLGSEDHAKPESSTQGTSTEEPKKETSLPESTSKGSVDLEQHSKPDISSTTSENFEVQTQPTNIDHSSEESNPGQTKPEIISETTEAPAGEQDQLEFTTEHAADGAAEIAETSSDSENIDNETSENPQSVVNENRSTTEKNQEDKENESKPDVETENKETPTLTIDTEFPFPNIGIRPLPFPLSPQESQIPVAIETVRTRS